MFTFRLRCMPIQHAKKTSERKIPAQATYEPHDLRTRIKHNLLYLTLIGSLLISIGIPTIVCARNNENCDIVFIKANLKTSNYSYAQIIYNTRFVPGGNLFLLRQGEDTPTNLTWNEMSYNGAATDPDVWYEGNKVVFSMRRNNNDHWYLWEWENTGGNGTLRQLTGTGSHGGCPSNDPDNPANYDDIDPCYLPDGKIIFTSNRPGHLNEYEMQLNELLHLRDTDGTVRQISFFLSGDYNPMIMQDGRLLWMRYEHQGRMDFFPLMTARPDGSNVEEFFGFKSPIKVFHEFTQMPAPDSRIISTACWHFWTWEAGGLVAVDPREGPVDENLNDWNQEWIYSDYDASDGGVVDLTPQIPSGVDKNEYGHEASRTWNSKTKDWDNHGRYRTPHALQHGGLLASWCGNHICSQNQNPSNGNIPDFAIWKLDFNEDGTIRNEYQIYNTPNSLLADIDAVPLEARPIPPNINSYYKAGKTSGELTCLNVYENSLADRAFYPEKGGLTIRRRATSPALDNDRSIEPGDIKKVRIIEGLPVYAQGNTHRRISHYHHEPKRILGEVDVEEDGSFKVEIPTQTPIHFQTLDADGRTLTTQLSWVYLQPGENKVCIGCHEERGNTPSNFKEMAIAASKDAQTLTPPAKDSYHFVRDIYPTIKRRCADNCHTSAGGRTPSGELDLCDDVSPIFNVGYNTLLPWIRPGSVRKCEVTRMMMGRRKVGGCGMGGTENGGYGGFTATEWEDLARWIELGVLFRYSADGQVASPYTANDFRNTIAPILKRQGCSATTCHGKTYDGAQYIINFNAFFSDSGGGPVIPIETCINLSNPERSRALLAPRQKIDSGLEQWQRDQALVTFTNNCNNSCHPAYSVYFSNIERSYSNIRSKFRNGCKSAMNNNESTMQQMALWLSEFIGNWERPTCPNVWIPGEQDYNSLLKFIRDAKIEFIGETDPNLAVQKHCYECHEDLGLSVNWQNLVNAKADASEWRRVIMKMLGQEHRFGFEPEAAYNKRANIMFAPEAAIIYEELRTRSGGTAVSPSGDSPATLLQQARDHRFAGEIDQAEHKLRQALLGRPDSQTESLIRLELGIVFTQYNDYPVISDAMKASRPFPRENKH